MQFTSHTLDVLPGQQRIEVLLGPFRWEVTIRIGFDVLTRVAGPLFSVFDEFERHRDTLVAAAMNAVRRTRARPGDVVEVTPADIP